MKWEDIHANSIRIVGCLIDRLREHKAEENYPDNVRDVAEHLKVRKFFEKEYAARQRYDYRKACRNLKIRSKKRYMKHVLVGSVAAACFIIIGMLALVSVPEKKRSALRRAEQRFYSPVKPGGRRAVLTLSGGNSVELGKSFYQFKEKGEVSVVVDSTGVVYGELPRLTETDVHSYNSLSVPRGGEYCVTLVDGTQVWMNADTRLRYPVVFTGNQRVVELTGEAFFEVVSDSTSPFIVKTGIGDVRVYGTRFNLKCYAEEHRIAATLVEGAISFSNERIGEVKLVPAEQLSYREGESVADIRKVKVQNYVSWRQNLLSFENETLEEIVKTLSRWYDVDIVFEDEQLKQLVFSGNLDKYSRIETFFQFFEAGANVRFEWVGNRIKVGKK